MAETVSQPRTHSLVKKTGALSTRPEAMKVYEPSRRYWRRSGGVHKEECALSFGDDQSEKLAINRKKSTPIGDAKCS
ncbi:MAG: hypothetical protein DME85_12740 [Verrucomicrobia bacterium]|nr:MAG: hypothetical protein DME85_12740 [Verrucomicrobiota bacterium]